MTRGHRAVGIGTVLFALGLAAPVRAEEGGFVPPPGQVWTALAYEGWFADRRFAGAGDEDRNAGFAPGDDAPIKVDDPRAEFRTDALWAKLRVAPIDPLIAGLSMAVYQRSAFEQTGTRVVTEGTGDLYTFAGAQLTPRAWPVGVSVYVHLKVPLTERPVGDLSVPLSEGQVDLGPELATTWAALPRLHVTARAQYRYRFPVDVRQGTTDVRITPADEVEVGFEVGGGPSSWLWLKTSYQGLWSLSETKRRTDPPTPQPHEKRQIHWWGVGAYLMFGGWIAESVDGLALDLKARLPVGGVDYLKGPGVSAGVAYGFSFAGQ